MMPVRPQDSTVCVNPAADPGGGQGGHVPPKAPSNFLQT